jgi:hypothetical protein
MPNELKHLPVSRQRRYYLRTQRKGHYATCGEALAPGSRLLWPAHPVSAGEYQRRKQGFKRCYSKALSYNLEPDGGTANLPARRVPRSARVRFTFDTDGLEVAMSSLSDGGVTKLGLTVSLQTFLTALTWVCSSNNVSPAGWLTVGLGKRSILCRVEGDARDSANPRLIPASKVIPPVLRGAIRALRRSHAANGDQPP